MLRVKCPDCETTIKCDQRHAGEQIKCPSCEHRFVVPFDTPDLEALQQEAEDRRQLEAALRDETPGMADLLPGKLDDLIELQQTMQAQQTEALEALCKTADEIQKTTRAARSDIRVIGLLLFIVALIGGCGILSVAGS